MEKTRKIPAMNRSWHYGSRFSSEFVSKQLIRLLKKKSEREKLKMLMNSGDIVQGS